MLDTTERPSTDKITEPAKRWRNWFRATERCFCNGQIYSQGDKIPGRDTHPSRDLAETEAAVSLSRCIWAYEYLGAYPVEAAP